MIFETYSERAYCDGFIRNDVLNQFKKFLKSESQKVVEYPYNGRTIVLTTKYFKCEDGNNHQKNGTNLHPDDDDENYSDTVEWQISQLSDESGYYIGPPMVSVPIDPTKWAMITCIDMTFGHHALEENGLFKCIDRALIASLKNG